MTQARVIAVAASPAHGFSKAVREAVTLIAGWGVQGDAHAGVTVKHRSRLARDPTQTNLRQLHLLHEELLDELRAKGFRVSPGVMGENITTRGVDLLGLPQGALLQLGQTAVVRVTGLRNPCAQLDHYQAGLTAAVLARDAQGRLVRKAGVMAVVVAGGTVKAGDAIRVRLPEPPYRTLEPV